ncbi:response regulator transcription factor [Ureibacillus sp. 179-F W5.1 NHS]|uniref:LuxR family transcriptional regulator n=1 Tax=Lysinibacillus halotolerans TaxID=1368476 RepID=A0A3M8H6Q3_9BACI|nr:helix-turn-helix transcriptional regulator [Lysinibacillus halotolerans]RNC98101.1 LuxR family transcriptional regulator [Lysinibacillus halotolerans]
MQITSWSIKEQLKRGSQLQTQEEQICHLLLTLEQLLDSEKLSFFRYSPVGYVGEGIAELEKGQFHSLTHIRDDIRSLPIIKKAVDNHKPVYYTGQDIITLISSRYQRAVPLKGLLVVPIVVNFMTIAYICCEYIESAYEIEASLIEQLALFGNLAGEMLIQSQTITHPKLSPRENEILRALANGFSTKELTNILCLSESTIKQYIKSALIKLGAKNRAHAVSLFLAQKL